MKKRSTIGFFVLVAFMATYLTACGGEEDKNNRRATDYNNDFLPNGGNLNNLQGNGDLGSGIGSSYSGHQLFLSFFSGQNQYGAQPQQNQGYAPQQQQQGYYPQQQGYGGSFGFSGGFNGPYRGPVYAQGAVTFTDSINRNSGYGSGNTGGGFPYYGNGGRYGTPPYNPNAGYPSQGYYPQQQQQQGYYPQQQQQGGCYIRPNVQYVVDRGQSIPGQWSDGGFSNLQIIARAGNETVLLRSEGSQFRNFLGRNYSAGGQHFYLNATFWVEKLGGYGCSPTKVTFTKWN